jgi:uncharacterized 2Fe-2S/4Fe-4S cluster protein (DUF4445 family)
MLNPQIAYGEDVVSRIAYSNHSTDNRRLLQKLLIDAINQAAVELCAQCGEKAEQIVNLVVVGNTPIHYFFCGLPVE